jgi:prevent-host-death family protein
LQDGAKIAIIATLLQGVAMKTMTARDAKNGFGLLLDTARAEPVVVEKHGRAVVVVLAIEEFKRLKGLDYQDEKKGTGGPRAPQLG